MEAQIYCLQTVILDVQRLPENLAQHKGKCTATREAVYAYIHTYTVTDICKSVRKYNVVEQPFSLSCKLDEGILTEAKKW